MIVFTEDALQMGYTVPWTPELNALGLAEPYYFFKQFEIDTFDRSYDTRRIAPKLLKALEAFREALCQMRGDPGLTFTVGYTLYYLRNYDGALVVLKELWSHFPELRSLLNVWIGNVLVARSYGGAREAVKWFDQAVLREPLWPYARYRAAIGYREAGDLNRAEAEAVKCLALEPDFPYAYYELGNICFRRGHFREAADHFQHALTLMPRLACAGYQLGRVWLAAGQKEKSREWFGWMVREFPRNPFGYIGLANMALLEGDRTTATTWLEQALAVDPYNPQANSNMGTIFLLRGDLEQAEAFFQRALLHGPSDPWVGYHLAVTLARRGKLVEAKTILVDALKNCESCPETDQVSQSAKELLKFLDSCYP
ncbi:MAG TPA: tetratricopeptide repeat protein [Bacillota bacterium]|nr:tetratricopeptide repeat protein [Bacillota bacterium]